MLDMASQTEENMGLDRSTTAQGDILVSVLDVLRRLPRRVVMILKLNDLARHLDHSLATTHSSVGIIFFTSWFNLNAQINRSGYSSLRQSTARRQYGKMRKTASVREDSGLGLS
ncbi:hypothetical protein BDR03DRAFT_960718, partial [Suillus americanus]